MYFEVRPPSPSIAFQASAATRRDLDLLHLRPGDVLKHQSTKQSG